MKMIFFILNCFLFSSLSANIGPQGFEPYVQNYFVETGTYMGGGIKKALKAGFKEIRSIEYSTYYYDYAVRKFSKKPQVKLYLGDSSKDLWRVIKDIKEPITFWLDAHISPPRSDKGKNCPLIEELEQIKRHPIKNHIILIDDMHCCGTEDFDMMVREDFIAKILEINPNYQISYVDGGDNGDYKNNVMVAICPE